ncbi:uncharacterized protein SPAPADRAFT_56179 [Spathaspora passalidarum NRRL Y-27907]|uniref:Uncharacterized protein n=1 Tax=Spathaspora passalidarum (strain NRRL Y-27907 / 11-Y1) TaxID=619300 RepID=G3ARI2_SPAPN|nr:uncharacterized protein SPAPADRAFT_56179 [Spathaspora passalidarum NRRL Y-27907]EGW31303.1 hypothetical protein SPAPADRAFT_56179 [Spathaspora passalidarum NRRL Y-27907]
MTSQSSANSSSNSLLSDTTKSITSPLRKQRFDDRSLTKTSLALMSYQSMTSLQSPSPIADNNQSDQITNIFKWSEMNHLSQLLPSDSPSHLLEATSIYIALSTPQGIAIFTYDQKLECMLTTHESIPASNITCMTFSSDSTFLAAGFTSGHIILWDMNGDRIPSNSHQTISPYYTINPITLSSRFTKNIHGHIINTKVTSLSFISNSISRLISVDDSGLVFYHNGVKKFMNVHFTCQKILGRNDANISDEKFKILQCEMLPWGNSQQITDQMGVVALMTHTLVLIISTSSLNSKIPKVKQHFKIGKSNLVGDSPELHTTLSWFPCMEVDGKVNNARLAYSYNNVLTILELDNSSFPDNFLKVVNDLKDKDKAIQQLPFRKQCRWINQGVVSFMKWVSKDILCVVTANTLVSLYYNGKSLKPVSVDNLDFTIRNMIQFKNRLLVSTSLIKLFMGKPLTWADILLEKLAKGDYHQALTLANNYYNSTNNGKLVLVGLPKDQTQRALLIQPYLERIMKESLPYLFKEEDHSYLTVYFNIIAYIGGYDILENLYEVVPDAEFFNTLEPFIQSGSIISLPPLVLKRLVEHYVAIEKGDILTELICTLDIRTLDIDLTISLCKQFELRDCLVYVWNFILHDYETPLIEFILDFSSLSRDDQLSAYTYMSYILTGRQYPTDRFIPIESATRAKQSICDILFSSTLVTRQDNLIETDNDSSFPYLYTFLKANSFEMLSTMNEFFEDPYLNESTLTRQYLTEALLDVYEMNDELTTWDNIQLAIFIGRNYPKYSQFLRLSESTITDMFDVLCSADDVSIRQDCELALASLLPFVPDDGLIIDKIRVAKYFTVLINVYKSKGEYSKALEVWLDKEHDDDNESVAQLIENGFMLSKNAHDRVNLIRLLRQEFVRFVAMDLIMFCNVVEIYCPSVHNEVLNIKDDALAYNYLKVLFEKRSDLEYEYVVRYLELICLFNRDHVFEYVNEYKKTMNDHREQCMEILKDHVDGQALLMVSRGEYTQAEEILLQQMAKITPSLESDESVRSEFNHLLQYIIKICDDAHDNEELWLELLHQLVDMSNSESTYIHDFINTCIHDCFRYISDNSKSKQQQLVIFNRFLEQYSSTDKIATLSNIRGVLQQVFISYSYESEMLNISLKMINGDIYKNSQIIKANKLKGWNIICKNCSSCGKVMWGSGGYNLDDHILAWEARQWSKAHDIELEDKEKFHHCELIFFKCEHGYHMKCLENLGANDEKYCVICE